MKNLTFLAIVAIVACLFSARSASANQVINLPPVVIVASPTAKPVPAAKHGQHCIIRDLVQGTGTVKSCYDY